MRDRMMRSVAALAVISMIAVVASAAKRPPSPEDLFNPMLGIDYSHWLVGPIVAIATVKEREKYLELVSDEQAADFVREFWELRNRNTEPFKKTPEQIFEARATEADKRYTAQAYPGRRSDRGKILVLYGQPAEIKFQSGERVGDKPLEVWVYGKGAEAGLDGKKPKKEYRFIETRDGTVLYTGQNTETPRERLQRRSGRSSG